MCWRGELLGGRRLGAFSWSPETRFLVFWENSFCLICSHTRTSFHFSACSVIVLVSRKQKSSTGTTISSKGKGLFSPTDWNDQTSQRGPPSKWVPNIPVSSDQTERVCSIWCTNQNFWNFGLNGKSPSFSVFRNFQVSCWKMEGNQLIDHSKVSAVQYSC